jgi:Cu-Zn family superoxide dismutase
MPHVRHACTAAVCALLLPAAASAEEAVGKAVLMNADGQEIGAVTIGQLASGAAHVVATADNVPPGVHAFHVHETGQCDGADGFKSAGGHHNPGNASHGWDSAGGPHAGDLPNVHVQEDGVLAVEYFSTVLLEDGGLFDDDGSAVVMHEGPDDYQTDPAGDAGARIACGVIEQP